MAAITRRPAPSSSTTKSVNKTSSTRNTDSHGATKTVIRDLQSTPAKAFFGTTFVIGLGLLQLFFLPELVGEYENEHHRFLLWERITHYTYSFALSALVIHYYYQASDHYRTAFQLHVWGYWLLTLLVQHVLHQVLHEIVQWTTTPIATPDNNSNGHKLSESAQAALLKMIRLNIVNVSMDTLGLALFVGYVYCCMNGSYQRLIMGRFVAEPILVFGTLLNLSWQTHMRFIRSWYHYLFGTELIVEDHVQWIHHDFAGLVAVPRHDTGDLNNDDTLVTDNASLLWLLFRVTVTFIFWCFYVLFFLGYQRHHRIRAGELKLLHSNTAAFANPEELDDTL